MRTLALVVLLVATAASAEEAIGMRMTSGWLTVLDVPGVLKATSADPRTVSVTWVGDDQVVLLGVMDAETVVSVWSGRPEAPHRTDYPMRVLRNTSVQPQDGLLTVQVDQPRSFQLPSVKRAAIGDGSVCEATLTGPDQLQLVARRPGTTSLLLWVGGVGPAHRKQLLITVESGGISRSADEVDATLTEPLTGRMVLLAGEHAILGWPLTARFAVKDEAVALLRLNSQGEIVVEGLAAGATRLLVWNGHQRLKSVFVVVHPRSPADAPVDDPIQMPELPAPTVTDSL